MLGRLTRLHLRVVIVMVAAACASCAYLPSVSSPPAPTSEPVGRSASGLDPAIVERLTPGTTPRETVRGWFGDPDQAREHADGSSRWVYVHARVETLDANRDAAVKQARANRRAVYGQQLRVDTQRFFEGGRRTVVRFGSWLDRMLFYPPSAERLRRAAKRESRWAEIDARKAAERPRLSQDDVDALDAGNAPTATFDLAIDFGRDGVVDAFGFQRRVESASNAGS